MPEKETQFFKLEAVPENKEEGTESLKKEEALTEQEKLTLEVEKRRERILEEKIVKAEEILARKEEMPMEEKTKLISHYIKEVEAMRNCFKDLTHEEIEEMLGEQESTLVFHIITEQNQLLQKMKENSVEKDQIQNFVEQRGDEMLPYRIYKVFHYLDSIQMELDTLLTSAWYLFREGDVAVSQRKEMKKESMRRLKVLLVDLERESQEWQKYQKFEREKEEKPMRISGFEGFDFPGIRGEEIIEKAAEILPRKLLSTNVREIKYRNIPKPTNKEKYGIDGESFASFSSERETKECDITFYKLPGLAGVKYLSEVPFVLAHEFGHSLDPRTVDQKDLTPGEQFQMIIEWEGVRTKEDERNSYILKINNQDKQREEALKSQESLAESAAYFLNDPFVFQALCPRRYEFIATLFKKRFPDFNLRNGIEARLNYDILMENLREKEKKSEKN